MVYFYVLCNKHILMKLVGYQQPTCLCVMTKFVIGTISFSCELRSLSKAAFVHVFCQYYYLAFSKMANVWHKSIAKNVGKFFGKQWFGQYLPNFSPSGNHASLTLCQSPIFISALQVSPVTSLAINRAAPQSRCWFAPLAQHSHGSLLQLSYL